MVHRPVDENGDMLPVLFSAAMLKGVRAEEEVTMDRLNLLSGDWWENPSWGNAALDMLKENRYTEADRQVIANYLTSYIRETPGVAEVRDVSFSMEGRQFRYACTVDTEDGTAEIVYSPG